MLGPATALVVLVGAVLPCGNRCWGADTSSLAEAGMLGTKLGGQKEAGKRAKPAFADAEIVWPRQGVEGAARPVPASEVPCVTVALSIHGRPAASSLAMFSLYGTDGDVWFRAFTETQGKPVLACELATESSKGVTQVVVPLSMIGTDADHDILCRYNGAKLELFLDGVQIDEGFPMGPVVGGASGRCVVADGEHDAPVHLYGVVIWRRALTDAEVTQLGGGARAIAARTKALLGPLPSMQYFRPHSRFNVGDTLPFFSDGLFRFYYLQDRGHHTAKGGLGAHQWAQTSSRDLVHWTRQPLAVPITDPAEASICTGSVFRNAGTFYAFYATRGVDGGERLSLAVGDDGVHFTKTQPNPFLVPRPEFTGGFRDPHVFRDDSTGLFHLVVSTTLRDGNRGCLAQYTSADLRNWEEVEPLLIEGTETPECPDAFEWNGRFYLIYSNGQVARYRISDSPLGPWRRPEVDNLDGGAARVMKTAAFTGNRRIGTASIWPHGYAGWAIFRELVQEPDGSLGTAFVREMMPRTGCIASIVREARGAAVVALRGMPREWVLRATLKPRSGARTYGIRVGGPGGKPYELVCDADAREVRLDGGASLHGVVGLDAPLEVELVLKGSILDLCLNGRRTLVNWLPEPDGRSVELFAPSGEVVIMKLAVRPIVAADPRGR